MLLRMLSHFPQPCDVLQLGKQSRPVDAPFIGTAGNIPVIFREERYSLEGDYIRNYGDDKVGGLE